MTAELRAEPAWPELHVDVWKDTLDTLQLWTQVVGKIRLAHEPMVNHWWQVALYVTSRGLTTSAMPCSSSRSFQIDFDFIAHRLEISDCDGMQTAMSLEPMAVATFYSRVMEQLREHGIETRIRTMPSEIPDAIPFEQDRTHTAYDRAYAHRFWRVLLQADRLAKEFRSRFIGKVSPVHLFWGALDLAVTRFSGRRAPEHPGGIPNLPDWITREAYSHEVSSCGFWPGGYGLDAMFYAYAYPEPPGFAEAASGPAESSYNTQLREFLLPYDAVRQSSDPDAMVLDFFQATYESAAGLGNWDRPSLERNPRSTVIR